MISIESISLKKPIKSSENIYNSSIYYKEKRNNLYIEFENVKVLSIKNSIDDTFIIYLKNKKYNDFLSTLNNYIIDIIKDKSSSWFHNNMNTELIDDYFTNTIVYNKKYGNIIRLKCINDDKDYSPILESNVCIKFLFKRIKFYKQKFEIECEIVEVSSIDDFIDEEDQENSDNEELAEPMIDDIMKIKTEIIEKINKQIKFLQEKNLECDILKEKVQNSFLLSEIIIFSEELDNLII